MQKREYLSPECITVEVNFNHFMQISGRKEDPEEGGEDALSKGDLFDWEELLEWDGQNQTK